MVIRDRVVLYAQPDALREPELEKLIEEARAVDMDDVRRRAAAQERSA
ncbi:hypothetical protein [Actinomadura madurae]